MLVALDDFDVIKISWRWPAAITLFLFAVAGFSSGVSLSERPDVITASLLTHAYYSLGLFVVGGLDLGTPSGGPMLGRALLWISYFGAPLLMASALVEALFIVMSPHRWRLRRLNGHVVIVGSGDISSSYLRVLRRESPTTPVVVVDLRIPEVRELELAQTFNVTVVVGDITHDFLLRGLRLKRAKRIILMGEDDFSSYEAASKILHNFPHLESKIIIHCNNLRFLRAMQRTYIANHSTSFNSYNLAAKCLVRDHLLHHFQRTEGRDIIVVAGFGRFGQTILEEIQSKTADQIDRIGIIDVDANRRIQVVEEQLQLGKHYNRTVFQGDVAHPEVWRNLTNDIDLTQGEPVIIFGTGDSANNLRTALWIRHKYPNTLIFVRTNDISEFAAEVCREHRIFSISITQLVEDNIPTSWLG